MDTLTYSRSLPIEDGFDIIVAGGGPAGVAAAVSAARLGRKVALIEQTGCLGGMGTNGLVNVFMPCADDVRELMGGIGREVTEKLYQGGFLEPHVTPAYWQQTRRGIPFNGEGMKLILDRIVVEAGVDLRFFTTLLDVISDSQQVTTLIVSGKERIYALRARYFVDTTGDATLAAKAGFPFACGDEQGQTQAGTLCSTMGNIDMARYRSFIERTRQPGDWQALIAPLEQAIKDGVFSQPDHHLPGIFMWGDGFGGLNGGHLFGYNFLNDKDMTQAMILGRKIAQEYLAFYREYVEGCEKIVHVATAALPGVRGTRRVVGEYVLNVDDFVARRSFSDDIGRNNYSVDIHRSSPAVDEYKALIHEITTSYHLGPGESYGIPYRSLIPKGARNLLVAGRCISADRRMQGSARIMPCCFVTGQAAGVAAALCCTSAIPPQALDSASLQHTLRQQDAYIP